MSEYPTNPHTTIIADIHDLLASNARDRRRLNLLGIALAAFAGAVVIVLVA